MKRHNLFVNSVITATLVIYHFPAALINIIFVFPLLHNSVSIFGWNKSKGWKLSMLKTVMSNIYFLIWLVAGITILFGSVLLRDLDQKQLDKAGRSIQEQVLHNALAIKNDMLATTIRDFECAGSNLWVYICVLLVPNILTIIQVQLFC